MTALVGASERDVLLQLVDELDRAQPFGGPPAVARLYASGDREIDILADTDSALSDALLGWRAPPSCTAIGTSASGWALHPDHWDEVDLDRGAARGPRPKDRADSTRVTTVMVASRSGLELSRLRMEGGAMFDEAGPDGGIADCLRRCLDRPTPPPALPSAYLFAAVWLDSVLSVAARTTTPLSWSRVARLHPAMELFERAGERMPVTSFVEVVRAMGNVLDWSQVRFEIVERHWLNRLCQPRLAAWMDDGMLSRWLLSAWPAVEELVDTVSTKLAPAVGRRARRSLHDLGLLRP